MAFPNIITQPKYTITLPSNKKGVSFRPFLESERKILLMAAESTDELDMVNAVKQVITHCSLTDLDVNKLPIIDIEYFFLQLRAKSIGEIIPMTFKCENVTEETGKACGNIMKMDVNITNLDVINLKTDTKIMITPTVAVKLNYPSLIETDTPVTSIDYLYELLASCIEYIADAENIYQAKDYSIQDLVHFLLNLTPEQFKKLENFISDTPSLTKSIPIKCSKCGDKVQFRLME